MGYATGSSEELQDMIIGFNDFFTEGECLSNLGEGRAKRMLAAFLAGDLRAEVDD